MTPARKKKAKRTRTKKKAAPPGMRRIQARVEILKPHPRNYRDHPEDQLEHIRASIRDNGFYRNVVLARDGTILAGHGVVLAAASMGLEKVPAMKLDLDPEDPRAIRILMGDNEIGHLGVVDDRLLTELLNGLQDADDDGGLLGTGYDAAMLANLIFTTRPQSEIKGMDEAAAWAGAGMPAFEGGQPPVRLVVSFRNEEDREKFATSHKLAIDKKEAKSWSTWWHRKERVDGAAVRYE
ncbi:MAG: ParB N-terminal domain-containing protein [Planctomycetota bacterium]|jgi:hypothetical protein